MIYFRNNRQCDPGYRDGMERPSHYDSHDSPYNHERTPPPNPRGSWGRGRRGKHGGRGGKGKNVTKADPPMILGGIPHLERSFVAARNENGGKNGSASSSQGNESSEGPEVNTSATPFGENQNASGQFQEGTGNNSCRENGNSSQEVSRREMVPMGEETTPHRNSRFEGELQLETVDSEEEYDNVSPSANVPQTATTTPPASVSASKDMNTESQTDSERLQEVAEADPAKLELETERYYDELLGKNEEEKKEGTEILSASQVAKITVAYKTDEQQKKDEETQKKEEEKKAEERQAQIETAWSILHQYWQFVSENPYDFNGWTYLLNHVESMVRNTKKCAVYEAHDVCVCVKMWMWVWVYECMGV